MLSWSKCLRSVGGCPQRERGCAEGGIFLSAWLVQGASLREGGFALSCWELGLGWIKPALDGSRQELSGACRALVGRSVMLTHPREECDNQKASERQTGAKFFFFLEEREGIDGGESKLSGFLSLS